MLADKRSTPIALAIVVCCFIMPYFTETQWVVTPDAAKALGCSPCTLKRHRDVNGGFLEEDVHYHNGPFLNSPIRWDVEACRQAMQYRNMLCRKADAAIRELLAA